MRIGWIGLGDLGAPMAARLVRQGHDVLVWNRSAGRSDALVEAGAKVATSPAEVAARTDRIGLCLTSHEAVAAVCDGPDGLFAGITRSEGGGVAVADFSTGAPSAARALHAAAAGHRVGWVDAPVSGGAPAAMTGELIVFAGGDAADVAALRPLFDALAVRTTHMGGPGSGQMTKLCNNMLVATNALAIAEMIAAARRAGIDVAALPAALQGGWADSRPLQIFGPRMAAQAFAPRLGAIGLMAKDIGLAKAMAAGVGARTPLLDAVRALYDSIDGARPGLPGPEADLGAIIGLFEDLPDGRG